MPQSNATPEPRPAKPAAKLAPPPKRAGFPMSAHPTGKWQKMVRGKVYYFGNWARRKGGKLVREPGDGRAEALRLYEEVRDDLEAGRKPADPAAVTVEDVCEAFYNAKRRKVEAGEMSARMLADYELCVQRLARVVGKSRPAAELAPADFAALRSALNGQYGPVRLTNEIARTKTVFNFAVKNRLIDRQPHYGTEFDAPARREMRVHREGAGEKLFGPAELRALIDAAGVPLRAMILLGVNCGFGNSDCGRLPASALDLEGGWVAFRRPKTGIARRAKLWPETAEALRAAVATRPEPGDRADAGLVFLTRWGGPWAAEGSSDAVTLQFGKLSRKLGVERAGRGFYALRHTFRTVADGARDLTAVRLVMGHADASIDANYTHCIDDARLAAVAGFVRAWLFPAA